MPSVGALLGGLLVCTLAGCFEPRTTRCSDGRLCPSNRVCHEPSKTCVLEVQLRACDELQDGDRCEFFGSATVKRCHLGVCREPACGDAFVDAGEECDDGNRVPYDGCSERCVIETPRWRVSDATAFAPRFDHAASYDSARDRILIFGGAAGGQTLDDSWVWDGDDETWTRLQPPGSPPARHAHTLVYMPTIDRHVLFGGAASIGAADLPANPLGDTWILEPGTQIWTPLELSEAPPARFGHAWAYDPEGDRLVLFGGRGSGAELDFSDTWGFDGARWFDIDPELPRPSPRIDHAMAYDASRDRLVLYGGGRLVAGVQITFDDTWEFDGKVWEQRAVAVGPGERADAGLVYHPRRETLLLVAGASVPERSPQRTVHADVWEYRAGVWSRLTVAGPSEGSPSPRDGAALVLRDAAAGAILLGGLGTTDPPLGDMWTVRFEGPAGRCGDGVVGEGEGCDTDDLGAVASLTCADLGFSSGEIVCSPQCFVDFSGCVP